MELRASGEPRWRAQRLKRDPLGSGAITLAGADALAIIAEVSLGLAGFSGVVVILGRIQRDAFLRLRLSFLLSVSFGAMLLALLPFALAEMSLQSNQIWLIATCVLAPYGIGVCLAHTPSVRRYRQEHPGVLGVPILIAGYGLTLSSSLCGVIGLAAPSERVGAYLAGLLFLVAQGVFMFVRILFTHPSGDSAA